MAIIDMGRKQGKAAVPLSRGVLGTSLTQCGLGRGLLPYQEESSSIQPFGHNRHGPKTVGCAPFRGGGCDPISHNVAWTEVYLSRPTIKWHLDPSCRLATIDMGRKLGVCPLLGAGALSPSSTMWPGPKSTSVTSGVFIHPAVWPQ